MNENYHGGICLAYINIFAPFGLVLRNELSVTSYPAQSGRKVKTKGRAEASGPSAFEIDAWKTERAMRPAPCCT